MSFLEGLSDSFFKRVINKDTHRIESPVPRFVVGEVVKFVDGNGNIFSDPEKVTPGLAVVGKILFQERGGDKDDTEVIYSILPLSGWFDFDRGDNGEWWIKPNDNLIEIAKQVAQGNGEFTGFYPASTKYIRKIDE